MKLEKLLPRLGELRGDFLRVVYTGTGSMMLGALESKADTFRSFQLIKRRAKGPAAARAEMHAGMDRAALVDRYMAEVPPPGDPQAARAAMRRLFVEVSA